MLRRSDDVRRVRGWGRWLRGLWVVGAVVAVVWASWGLDAVATGWRAVVDGGWAGVGWGVAEASRTGMGLSGPVADGLANGLLYVPIGVAGAMAGAWLARRVSGRTGWVWAVAWVVGTGLGAGLSAVMEMGQVVMADRVASWWDVVVNTAGAGMGAGLWLAGTWWLRRWVYTGRGGWSRGMGWGLRGALWLGVWRGRLAGCVGRWWFRLAMVGGVAVMGVGYGWWVGPMPGAEGGAMGPARVLAYDEAGWVAARAVVAYGLALGVLAGVWFGSGVKRSRVMGSERRRSTPLKRGGLLAGWLLSGVGVAGLVCVTAGRMEAWRGEVWAALGAGMVLWFVGWARPRLGVLLDRRRRSLPVAVERRGRAVL
ncbi:MAG: VanZ family protein [Planctomycetota bacterium]